MKDLEVLLVTEFTQPQFGHMRLASKLNQEGVRTDTFVDALQRESELFHLLRENKVSRTLGRKKPKIIGFSVYDYTAPGMDQFFDKIRAVTPSSIIGIGGPLPSVNLKGAVKVTNADFGIGGSAEFALTRAAKALKGYVRGTVLDDERQKQLMHISSFYGVFGGRDVEGLDSKNYLGERLEELPLDFQHYDKGRNTGSMGLITSLGCGYRSCFFCTPQLFEGEWYGMSVDRIVEILEDLKSHIDRGVVAESAKVIKFQDNDFFFDRARVIEFSERLKQTGLGDYFTFESAQTSIDSMFVGHDPNGEVDTELITAAASFMGEIGLGTDGFNKNDLKRMGKFRYEMKHVEKVARAISKVGLPQRHYAILTAYETSIMDLLESSYNILRFAAQYKPFRVDANSGTQAFVGTRTNREALARLKEGIGLEYPQQHYMMSAYFEFGNQENPEGLRTMQGLNEFLRTGETDLPVFVPGIVSRDSLVNGFIERLEQYCVQYLGWGVTPNAYTLARTLDWASGGGLDGSRPNGAKSTALGYIKKLNSIMSATRQRESKQI